jgi:hypothetical protein
MPRGKGIYDDEPREHRSTAWSSNEEAASEVTPDADGTEQSTEPPD